MTDNGITDEAIIYQLEKVDQGGDITDLCEDRIHLLAKAWGFPIEDDEESDGYGYIRLPDGRHAGLSLQAFIQ